MTAEWLVPSLLPEPGTRHLAARELARTDYLFNAIGGTIYSRTSDIQRRIIAAEFGIVE